MAIYLKQQAEMMLWFKHHFKYLSPTMCGKGWKIPWTSDLNNNKKKSPWQPRLKLNILVFSCFFSAGWGEIRTNFVNAPLSVTVIISRVLMDSLRASWWSKCNWKYFSTGCEAAQINIFNISGRLIQVFNGRYLESSWWQTYNADIRKSIIPITK